jgi:mRNA interferase HigB
MRLFRLDVLDKFVRKHRDAGKWLAAWRQSVDGADWRNIGDVRRAYPSADGVKLKSQVVVTVFNVKGNEYRLLSYVNYHAQTLVILELLTHADYDKQAWKDRY